MKALCVLMLMIIISAGCAPENPAVKQVQPVKALRMMELQNLKEKEIAYTKAGQNPVLMSNLNNVFYTIEEFYNANKKEYDYILSLKDQPLENISQQKGPIPFNIIKLSAEAGGKHVSSPILAEKTFIKSGSYFLFSSVTPLKGKDFQIEGFFVNRVPFDDKKAGEETFHYLNHPGTISISN